jgi:acetyl-CoA C-acetyltransferase
VFIAGGVESMSRAPYSMPKNPRAWGPPGNVTAFDTTLGWRYPNRRMEKIFPLEAMGVTAENIAELSRTGEIAGGEITREEQDAFALESQARACAAISAGRFAAEIAPVTVPQRKGEPTVVDTDEHPRIRKTDRGYELATSLETLAKLRPAFRSEGSVTAGNSSGLNDGACALVMMSAEAAAELGFRPMARWVGSGAAGVDPRTMGLGPIPATRKALSRAGLELGDVDLVELNEAFAVQAIAVMRELGLRPEITNVNGGAIALGHPLGCSGARILTTLLHEMRRRAAAGESLRYGLATLCVGVGQGEAALIELLNES